MAITDFTTDYINRTTDINVLLVNSYTSNTTQKTTVAFGTTSQYITGIEKLVQRYTILFFTILGSQINYPTFGTSFLSDLQNSPLNLSKLDVLHLFNFANLDVASVFTNYQEENPDQAKDEQFQSAVLTNFSVSNGNINMQIAITSIAGDNITFILPIPLNN
jgi:hypothetical protein